MARAKAASFDAVPMKTVTQVGEPSYTSGGSTYYYSFPNNYINNDRNSTTGSTLTALRARQGQVSKYNVAYRGNIVSGANGTGNVFFSYNF